MCLGAGGLESGRDQVSKPDALNGAGQDTHEPTREESPRTLSTIFAATTCTDTLRFTGTGTVPPAPACPRESPPLLLSAPKGAPDCCSLSPSAPRLAPLFWLALTRAVLLVLSLLTLFFVVASCRSELIRPLLPSLRRDDGRREEEERPLRPTEEAAAAVPAAAAAAAGATTPRASAGTEGMFVLSWPPWPVSWC